MPRFVFKDSPEAITWSCINARERFVSLFETLATTVLQRIMQVVTYRSKHSPPGALMSAAECARHWTKNFRKSSSKLSEEVSSSFIDKSTRLWDGMLGLQTVRQRLYELEELYGKKNPFNNMDALTTLARKVQGDSALGLWLLNGIEDMIRTGVASTNDFSAAHLSPGVGKGLGHLDVLIGKRNLLEEFLGNFLPQNKFTPEDLRGKHIRLC